MSSSVAWSSARSPLHHQVSLSLGNDRQDDAWLPEISLRDSANISRRDTIVSRGILLDVPGSAGHVVVQVEPICLPQHARQIVQQPGADRVLRPFELALRDPL